MQDNGQLPGYGNDSALAAKRLRKMRRFMNVSCSLEKGAAAR